MRRYLHIDPLTLNDDDYLEAIHQINFLSASGHIPPPKKL
jgi:hypothetical protein